MISVVDLTQWLALLEGPKKLTFFLFVCLFSVSGTALRAFTFMSLSLDLSVV